VSKVRSRDEIINNLADKIDRFERYKQPHSTAMSETAEHLARRFGLPAADVQAIAEAARLHDIGLYAMSPAYHGSPNELRFEERLDLWRHSIIGEQEMAKREASRLAQLLVRWHHEAWNGSGYPDRLAFEDIPIGARILRAVEFYYSLLADRPYRRAFSRSEAQEMLQASAGIECDPYIVHAMLRLLAEMEPPIEEPVAPAVISSEPEPVPEVHEEPQTLATTPMTDAAVSAPVAETPSKYWAAEESSSAQSSETSEAEQPETAPIMSPSENLSTGDDDGQIPNSETANMPPVDLSAKAPASDGEADANSSQPMASSAAEIVTTPAVEKPATLAYEPLLPPARQAESVRTEIATAPKPYARLEVDDSPNWRDWRASSYNSKSLLGFEVSVLRQLPFETIAIAFSGDAKLDWYLKLFRKRVLANDSRTWAAIAARAAIETDAHLSDEQINRLLEDIYIPGTRLTNPHLTTWFRETDAWWLENLRRNINELPDDRLQAEAFVLGMQTGDYALSFHDATLDLRRPLSKVFLQLAKQYHTGAASHSQNRSFNLPPQEFLRQARADLLYLNLPPARTETGGAQARSTWRESWVTGRADSATDTTKELSSLTSKHSYLLKVDEYLRASAHIKRWAIGCQEIGLTSARDLSELIKEHRPIRATYSKDVSEVAGGLRSYIIVADR
jgi:hypothetical protein